MLLLEHIWGKTRSLLVRLENGFVETLLHALSQCRGHTRHICRSNSKTHRIKSLISSEQTTKRRENSEVSEH